MEPRISIITLGVKDLARSTAFYKDGLGLPIGKESSNQITFFETKGCWIALFPKEKLAEDAKVPNEGNGFPGFTLAHNVKTKEEVDLIVNKAVLAGAVVTDPPHLRNWGGYSGYFKDLDGYLWEIAWSPGMSSTE